MSLYTITFNKQELRKKVRKAHAPEEKALGKEKYSRTVKYPIDYLEYELFDTVDGGY